MTVRGRMMVAAAGSAGILLGALGFQYLGGLTPCPLCIYQRWPHMAGVVLAALGVTLLWRYHRAVSAIGMLAMLAGAGIGLYHTGIERGWWPGPDTCTSGTISELTTDELLTQIMNAPLVRCDEVQWDFLGLSMASWNALISLGLAGLWLAAAVLVPNPHDKVR